MTSRASGREVGPGGVAPLLEGAEHHFPVLTDHKTLGTSVLRAGSTPARLGFNSFHFTFMELKLQELL